MDVLTLTVEVRAVERDRILEVVEKVNQALKGEIKYIKIKWG